MPTAAPTKSKTPSALVPAASKAPETKSSGPPPAPLTDAELLDLSGEDSLDAVRELNLRAKGLRSLTPWAERVPSLSALSLSHNHLSSLHGLSSLRFLTTLNLNFNSLTSLDGLQHCPLLQHLFVANNMVRDLAPLSSLQELRTLSMYRNAVASLDAALSVLCMLPLLHALELGGNPCSLVPGYKTRMVMSLPALGELDGEQLTELDLEMAAEEEQEAPGPQGRAAGAAGAAGGPSGTGASSAQVLVLDHGAPDADPSSQAAGSSSTATHPPAPQQTPTPAAQRQAPAASSSSGPPVYQRPGTAALRPGTAAMRPGTAAVLRPGTSQRPSTANVRLVGNEFLNEHPVLLEYLARHVLEEGLAIVQQGAANGEGGMVGRLRSSFVARLRGTAAVNLASESMLVKDIAASGQEVVSGLSGPDARAAALETLVTDASPQETIRQLVRLCEVLIKEVEAGRQAHGKRPSSSGGGGRPGTSSSSSRPGTSSGQAGATSSRPGTGSSAASSPSRPGSSQRKTAAGAAAAAGGTAGGTANGPAAAAGPGGAAQAGSDAGSAEVERLHAEIARLNREVKALQVENANVYWLAEQYKSMKAELQRLRGDAVAS